MSSSGKGIRGSRLLSKIGDLYGGPGAALGDGKMKVGVDGYTRCGRNGKRATRSEKSAKQAEGRRETG